MQNSSSCTEKNYKLTAKQLENFNSQGYLILKTFSENEVTDLLKRSNLVKEKAFDLAINGGGTPSLTHDPSLTSVIYGGSQFVVKHNENGPSIQRVVWAGAYDPKLLEYGRSPQITVPVSQILESNEANHIINQIHFKLPHDKVKFLWHHDIQNRMAFSKDWQDLNGKGSYVVAITAIDKNTIGNGPLYVIPGSHKQKLEFPRFVDTDELPETAKSQSKIPILLEPGDTVFFHAYLLHASWENESSEERKVLINGFSYPGSNTCQHPGNGSGETIVLGMTDVCDTILQ